LHGLLKKLRKLGVPLISVHRGELCLVDGLESTRVDSDLLRNREKLA